jgi:hypothetical protein
MPSHPEDHGFKETSFDFLEIILTPLPKNTFWV